MLDYIWSKKWVCRYIFCKLLIQLYLRGKIDIDEERELAIKYEIMSIPTFVILKNGEVSETAVGMRDKEELIKLIEK